jgi:hypothetical protein
MSTSVTPTNNSESSPTPEPPEDELWSQIKKLTIHTFIGVGVFILIAIPAIALDIFNQGIDLVQFAGSNEMTAKRSDPSQSTAASPKKSQVQEQSAKDIKVSEPVKELLHLVELFLLGLTWSL